MSDNDLSNVTRHAWLEVLHGLGIIRDHVAKILKRRWFSLCLPLSSVTVLGFESFNAALLPVSLTGYGRKNTLVTREWKLPRTLLYHRMTIFADKGERLPNSRRGITGLVGCSLYLLYHTYCRCKHVFLATLMIGVVRMVRGWWFKWPRARQFGEVGRPDPVIGWS